MRLLTPAAQVKLSARQLSAAAENFAASQFAMCGFDVLEQGVRARYFYDLGVANPGGMLRVTVCGSLCGFWNLIDLRLEKGEPASPADYHCLIGRWLDRQGARVTYCLVQFESGDLNRMPRIYLASAVEIAAKLHESVEQLGDPALYEQYEMEDGSGRHAVETLPARWRFSHARIAELMNSPEGKPPLDFRFSEAASCKACAAEQPAACLNCLPMMN